MERSHGVYQDRFVKELALQRITTLETANRLLDNGFTDGLNRNLARPPAEEADFHRPVPAGVDLGAVFCWEAVRTVRNDWTFQFHNQPYQICEENRPLPKPREKVVVRVRLNGTLELLYRDQPLVYKPISAEQLRRRRQAAHEQASVSCPSPGVSRPRSSNRSRSPWRQGCILMFADTGATEK